MGLSDRQLAKALYPQPKTEDAEQLREWNTGIERARDRLRKRHSTDAKAAKETLGSKEAPMPTRQKWCGAGTWAASTWMIKWPGSAPVTY